MLQHISVDAMWCFGDFLKSTFVKNWGLRVHHTPFTAMSCEEAANSRCLQNSLPDPTYQTVDTRQSGMSAGRQLGTGTIGIHGQTGWMNVSLRVIWTLRALHALARTGPCQHNLFEACMHRSCRPEPEDISLGGVKTLILVCQSHSCLEMRSVSC
jgi:hypothetical protein